ncbi:MAG: response regulator [Candidatus Binatia bacterium]
MPEKILLADDDRVTLGNLCQFLDEEGYEVKCATNGLQALKLLEEERFDLVLSDIFMPEMNGYELLDQMRGRFARTPMILMTGDFTLRPPRVFGEADGYLLKPLDFENLMHTIRAVLKETQPRLRFKKRSRSAEPHRPVRKKSKNTSPPARH